MLNGWHRLLIVVAAAWMSAVIGLLVFEFQVWDRETGDGLLTCWEPYGSSPSSPVGKVPCGVLPRPEVNPGSWGRVLPGTRYFNHSRFWIILLGPWLALGFGIAAVAWISRGFRVTSSRGMLERDAIRQPAVTIPLGQVAPTHAQRWLDQLPRRWARNSAIVGVIATVALALPFMLKGEQLIASLAMILTMTLSAAAGGFAAGFWARSGLRKSFQRSPMWALSRIRSNWLIGALSLGLLLLASDLALSWRGTTPLFRGGVSAGDLGYLTGYLGTWLGASYLTSLVSRRGLRRAINIDERTPSYVNVRSDASSVSREFSVG